jgi:hypothetical protein
MSETPENQQQYGSILTILGENAEQNGKLQNKQITFTHIAIGDANDTYIQPDRKQTALTNELARIPVNSVDVLQPTPESVPMLKVEAVLPDDVNDLVIREFAAVATFDGNTYFHAVGNCARIYVPAPVNNGNVSTPVTLEMIFVITSAEPIVEIDPNVVTASREYVHKHTGEVTSKQINTTTWPITGHDAKIDDVLSYSASALWINGSVRNTDKVIPSGSVIETINEQGNLVTASGVQYKLGGAMDKATISLADKIRTLKDKLEDNLHVKDFGVVADDIEDDSDAFQNAVLGAYYWKRRLDLGTGVIRITRSIKVPISGHYSRAGSYLFGNGRDATRIKLDYTHNEAEGEEPIPVLVAVNGENELAGDGYNFIFLDATVTSTNENSCSASIHIPIGVSGLVFDNLILDKAIDTLHLQGNAWVNSFTNIMFYPRDMGVRMDASGTTNWFDGLFVFGSNVVAYKIRSIYSAVGALAADNCIGTIYDFQFSGLSVHSLGSEQPGLGRTPSVVVHCDNGHVNVTGHVYMFRSAPTDGTEWTGIKVGQGEFVAEHLTVDKHDQNSQSNQVNGKLFDGYTGTFRVGNIEAYEDSNERTGMLEFLQHNPINSPISIRHLNTPGFMIRGDGKPFIGMGYYDTPQHYHGLAANLSKRPSQSLIFDVAGWAGGSGIGENYDWERDRWDRGCKQGSILVEVEPLERGRAGYSCYLEGVDMNSVGIVAIPIITTVAPTKDLITGQQFFHPTLKKPLWWAGSGWVDALGQAVTI